MDRTNFSMSWHSCGLHTHAQLKDCAEHYWQSTFLRVCFLLLSGHPFPVNQYKQKLDGSAQVKVLSVTKQCHASWNSDYYKTCSKELASDSKNHTELSSCFVPG